MIARPVGDSVGMSVCLKQVISVAGGTICMVMVHPDFRQTTYNYKPIESYTQKIWNHSKLVALGETCLNPEEVDEARGLHIFSSLPHLEI